MTQPYIAEVRLFPYDFTPRGWALCDGRLLAIAQNQALFALIGTTYGGNGTVTFALPDLRGRTALHWGSGYTWGEMIGEETHRLQTQEIPAHGHQAMASSAVTADQVSPTGALWANGAHAAYSSGPPNSPMHGAALATTGNSQPHENRSPYLTLSYCIALQGLFPSRN